MEQITVWQRAVLNTLYCEEVRLNRGIEPEAIYLDAVVSRRALEIALWFDWQSYHTKKMKTIIDQKWVTEITDTRGILYYVLTDAARATLWSNWSAVSRHVTTQARKAQAPF